MLKVLTKILKFLLREWLSVFLLLVTFLCFLFISFILNISLINWSRFISHIGAELPQLSNWINKEIVWHRSIAYLFSISVWLFLLLWYIKSIITSKDSLTFKINFLYALITTWSIFILISLSVISLILMPFDIPLEIMSGAQKKPLEQILYYILVIELLLIPILPILILSFRKHLSKKAI
ncbi:MAG: hypothetical protein KAI43_10490 [Candidatus Aureabacteria bacterium]|nr:hypothetical protein [Candidatus Auribacterota bacterium]